jgi:NDP-sugar pyrophosphorylase family protein
MTVEIKNDMTNLREIDVVILCGGLGKRLRPTFKGPKVLAKIGEKAFLDILIDNLLMHGFKNIILSVGYLKEQIKNYFNYDYNKSHDCLITFSEEKEPLGTGGALKKAKTRIISNPFMVVNGDSICKVNFRSFIEFHIEKKALISMVLVHSNTTRDYGNVVLNESQKITDFNEKIAGKSDNLVNAGIYLMKKEIFTYMPKQKKFSLEYELFPQIIKNRFYGFLTESELIDIGTPERYEKAINLLKSDTTDERGGERT